MGFLATLIERITGTHATVGETEQSGLMEVVTELLANPQTGGIQGLINTFRE